MHFTGNQPPWIDEHGNVTDSDLELVYRLHRQVILATHRLSPVQSRYNVPVANALDIETIRTNIYDIFQAEQRAFK